jgi:hypothetical protein
MKIIISEKQLPLLKSFLKESKINENMDVASSWVDVQNNPNEKATDESLVNKLVSHAEKMCMNSPELVSVQKVPNTELDTEEGLKNFNVWTVTIRNGNNPLEYILKPESFIVKHFSIGSTELGQGKPETFIISPEFAKRIENRFSQIERTKSIKQKQIDNQKSAKEELVNQIVGN